MEPNTSVTSKEERSSDLNGTYHEGPRHDSACREAEATPSQGTSIVVGTPEWDALTARRATLIRKKVRSTLTEEEQKEFERLQQLSQEITAATFPTPLPELDSRLDALEKALAAKEGAATQ